MITIHTIYSKENENDFYNILLETYEKSIRKNMTDIVMIKDELIINENEKPKMPSSKLFSGNVIPKEYHKTPVYKLKLQYQKDIIDNINTNIILSDCDMLMLKSVENIFDMDFDIAFTEREKKFINTGIVFVKKPNKEIKNFFKKWNDKVRYLYNNPDVLEKNKKKYTNGLNQCALGLILKEYKDINNKNLKIKYLPSSIYNSCQDTWKNINNNTKFVHIKSALRNNIRNILNNEIEIENVEPQYLQPIINKWFEYYNSF